MRELDSVATLHRPLFSLKYPNRFSSPGRARAISQFQPSNRSDERQTRICIWACHFACHSSDVSTPLKKLSTKRRICRQSTAQKRRRVHKKFSRKWSAEVPYVSIQVFHLRKGVERVLFIYSVIQRIIFQIWNFCPLPPPFPPPNPVEKRLQVKMELRVTHCKIRITSNFENLR